MRPFSIFNIILAIAASIMVIAGAMILDASKAGYWILYAGLFLAAVFTITSIIDVIKAGHLMQGRRTLWLIMVICVPVLGGLLYYLIHYGKKGHDVISAPDSEGSF